MAGPFGQSGHDGVAAQRPYIAVIGASQATPADLRDAEAVGRRLGEAGAVLVCGGRGGVMAAAARGCRETGAEVIGMLPGSDRSDANEWVSIGIPTGLGELRNGLIVRTADAIVAVGGAYGTLSEIALGLQASVAVFGLHTWEIDGVVACGSPGDAVRGALEVATGGVARASAGS